jgi:hypothetical protein
VTPIQEFHEAAHKARLLTCGASLSWRVDVVGGLGANTILAHNDIATNSWRDAAYIAPMGPRFGLALADLFDAVPGTLDADIALLRLARAYLDHPDGAS